MEIKAKHLKRAKYENVIRLAKALLLNIEGMNNRQVIKYVAWALRIRSKKHKLHIDYYK